MASYVKSVDSNHMLSVGEEGFFGASNLNYVQFNPGEGNVNTWRKEIFA